MARLAAALRELDAGIRVDDMPTGIPFDTSAEALLGMKMLNLRTPHGDLDLTFRPAAFPRGYDDLIDRAEASPIGTATVHIAALEDVIASKTAAGRIKDFEALPELHAIAAHRHSTASPVERNVDTGATGADPAVPEPPDYGPAIGPNRN